MKMLTDNTSRREALKRLAAIGALALLPTTAFLRPLSGQKTHFVGLGGAGFYLLSYFQSKLPNARYTWLDTELPAQVPGFADFIQTFSAGHLHDSVKSHLTGNDKIVLMAGLGGETGTPLMERLSWWLHDNRREFMVICNMPFTFQGRKIRERALQTKSRLSVLPNFRCLDLDDIGKPYGHMLLREVFERADQEFYAVYREMTAVQRV